LFFWLNQSWNESFCLFFPTVQNFFVFVLLRKQHLQQTNIWEKKNVEPNNATLNIGDGGKNLFHFVFFFLSARQEMQKRNKNTSFCATFFFPFTCLKLFCFFLRRAPLAFFFFFHFFLVFVFVFVNSIDSIGWLPLFTKKQNTGALFNHFFIIRNSLERFLFKLEPRPTKQEGLQNPFPVCCHFIFLSKRWHCETWTLEVSLII